MNETTSLIKSNPNQSSPFDAIRGYRANGSEYWTGRELMKWLGYVKWDKFQSIIEQAIENIELSDNMVDNHVATVTRTGKGNGLEYTDYEFSRLACYHVSLACVGKGKPMVAMAKQYFAIQTRRQEIAESFTPSTPSLPCHSAVEYINATATLAALPDSRLKRLLDSRLVAELSIYIVNQKQIGSTEPVKNYTTATVRAAMLGYSANQIGNGSSLGKFIKSEIAPDFSDWQGQFNVAHYEVCDALDSRIHAYFLTRAL
jgi:hypothetical protein